MVRNSPAMQEPAGDAGLIPGSGRSPGGGHGNPLQHSCLENPTDRGAWRATVHGVRKSQTQLKWLSMHSWGLHWWTIQGSKRYCFVITMGVLHWLYCIREDMFDKTTRNQRNDNILTRTPNGNQCLFSFFCLFSRLFQCAFLWTLTKIMNCFTWQSSL